MKEPLNVRLSDCSDPRRGEKFEKVLLRRRASASYVLRGLADAYIRSDGMVDFPVRIIQDSEEQTFGAAAPPPS